MIRSVVGFYDKKKVFRLPITREKVLAAMERSRANFVESQVISEHPQTAIHLIIDQVIERDVLKVGNLS